MSCQICTFANGDNKAPEKLQDIMCMKAAKFESGDRARSAAFMSVKKGFKWSENIKPIAKTEWCMKSHFGYCLKGKMVVTMKDGSKQEVNAGDAYFVPPEHDAEVMEDLEGVEFEDNHLDLKEKVEEKKE